MRPVFCTLTVCILAAANTSFTKPVAPAFKTATSKTYTVLIIKTKYEMRLYDSTGTWITTYPVVFGNKDLGDKMMQGDKKTPEGIFHITDKRKHEKWNSFLMIDYPNQESYEKFNRRKEEGIIPADAKIGGGIGIHGTWPNEDYAIDQYQNWTEGCISTKNRFIEELFLLLPVGTKVEIRH